jgi:outer membrane lipoprotein carrier protein
MKHRTPFIVLVTLSWVRLLVPQEAQLSVKDITQKMQSRYEMIDDATASFVKHVTLGFSNIEQTYTGTIMIKKPSKLRMESANETIVTDGVTVWLYSPANNQVIIDKYKENQNSISPENFLLALPQNYYATLLGVMKEKSASTALIKLVPKDDRSFVQSVKISVEEGTWNVRTITILDVNDTETTYTIKDLKLNTNLDDKNFIYTPPAGVEVVDLR